MPDDTDNLFDAIEALLATHRSSPPPLERHEPPAPRPTLVPWSRSREEQRFGERAGSGGNPLAFARSTMNLRDALTAYQAARFQAMDLDERTEHAAILDALAWAIEAERFLGTVSGPQQNRLRMEDVDAAAANLLLWLHYRGYEIRPLAHDGNQAGSETDDSIPQPGVRDTSSGG